MSIPVIEKTINFTLVNSAINSVFALCKAIDQDLERVGLV